MVVPAGALAAACIALLVASLQTIDLSTRDFDVFYRSAQAVRLGQPLYANAGRLLYTNLNVPTAALILAPLSALREQVAFFVFSGIGACSAVAAIAAARRELQLSTLDVCFLLILFVLAYPAAQVWVNGQFQILCCYPMVRAWRAMPHWRSGLWLAPVIAIKPTFLLMTLLLPPGVLVAAVAGALLLTASTLPLVGLPAWRDWLAQPGGASWLGIPENGSVWGVVARLHASWDQPWRLTDAGAATIVVMAGLAAACAVRTLRARPDRRFVGALLWQVLFLPVGWVSYLAVAIVPAFRQARSLSQWWARVGLAMVLAPWLFRRPVSGVLGSQIAMSVSVVGVALVWYGWTADSRRREMAPGRLGDLFRRDVRRPDCATTRSG